MLHEGEPKELVQRAEAAFNSADYANCLVFCRQALFVGFESHYDARMFLETKRSLRFDLDAFLSKVPQYARDRRYLEENVKEPTAFVIYDHNVFEMDLMKNGVDPVTYWNVWRLTPEVYRGKQDDRWIVKHDLRKFESEGIKDRAEYVLVTTTDILLICDQKRGRTRSPDYGSYYLMLRGDGVPVYSKASRASAVEQITPPGVRKVICDYSISSLDDSGTYWHVIDSDADVLLFGFIHEEDVDN